MVARTILSTAMLTLTLMVLQTFGEVKAAVMTEANWPVLCPPLTYYNKQQKHCLTCSSCPNNKIITSPCHGFHDTKCGPFYDSDLLDPTYNDLSKAKGHPSKSNSGATDASKSGSSKLQNSENAGGAQNGNSHPDVISSEFSHWQALTWVICGAIVFLVVCITAGGIWLLRRKLTEHRKLMDYKYTAPPEDV